LSYKYCIHTYLFSQRHDRDLEFILDKAKEFGSRGLDCSTCAGITRDCDIISDDAAEQTGELIQLNTISIELAS
jgi:hypothetical protein